MARRGGITSKFYRETAGLKVSGGQEVKTGTLLTRQGDRWKPGVNVVGRMHLSANCDGQVYFTKKKGNYGRAVTTVHIRPLQDNKKKS